MDLQPETEYANDVGKNLGVNGVGVNPTGRTFFSMFLGKKTGIPANSRRVRGNGSRETVKPCANFPDNCTFAPDSGV